MSANLPLFESRIHSGKRLTKRVECWDSDSLLLGNEVAVKTLFLEEIGRLGYRETAPPEVPDGWVKVRMRTVGICGSDIHYFVTGRIGDQVVTFPHILGHEGCGEIVEGAGELAPGTCVYLEPAVVCHECDQCRAGRENTCRKLAFFGNPGEFPGCMREEVAAPLENAVPMPPAIGSDEAFLLEPLCIGVYAVVRSRFARGGTALVTGCGPIGLSVLAGLSEFGPSAVYMSDPVPERRRAAQALGATEAWDPEPVAEGVRARVQEASGGGVDVAFECAATKESVEDAIRSLKPGGTLMLIGIPEDFDFFCFDSSHMRRHEITIVNVRRQNRMTARTISLLERRRDLKRVMITHRFRPEQANEAFDLVRERKDGVIKAVLEF